MRTPKVTSVHDDKDTLMGGNRQVLLSSKETEGDVYLVEGIMPPGSSVPLHIHRHEDELFHVLQGKVEVVLGEETITGKAGDIIYLPRGVQHAISTQGEETAKVLNYVIPGRGFEQFFSEMSALGKGAPKEELAMLAAQYGITFL